MTKTKTWGGIDVPEKQLESQEGIQDSCDVEEDFQEVIVSQPAEKSSKSSKKLKKSPSHFLEVCYKTETPLSSINIMDTVH